jgi:hypothetical protein
MKLLNAGILFDDLDGIDFWIPLKLGDELILKLLFWTLLLEGALLLKVSLDGILTRRVLGK